VSNALGWNRQNPQKDSIERWPRLCSTSRTMANYRKVLSVDNEMLINQRGDTAVLFVNQRTGPTTIAKKPIVIKGTTPNRLRLKMKHFINHHRVPVS